MDLERSKKYQEKNIKTIHKQYVLKLINGTLQDKGITPLKMEDLSIEIVELNQRQLFLNRQLKKAKEVQNASNY